MHACPMSFLAAQYMSLAPFQTFPYCHTITPVSGVRAWLLRREAFLGFDYDPDAVFSEKTDDYGFRK